MASLLSQWDSQKMNLVLTTEGKQNPVTEKLKERNQKSKSESVWDGLLNGGQGNAGR